MDLTGKHVQHRKFGEGVIVKQNETMIDVAFHDETKKFIYPACFNTFLEIADVSLKKELQTEVIHHEQAEAMEKKQHVNELQSKISSNRAQSNEKSVRIQPFASVENFCQAYRQALYSELAFIRKTGGKHIHLQDGKQIEKGNMRFVYLFEAEDELSYPDGTPITIWRGQSQIAGKILNCESFSLYLSSEVDFGTEVEALDISAEAGFLFQALSDRLIDLSLTRSPIVQSLVCDGLKSIEYKNSAITKGQQSAVEMSLLQPITFVWGPPGTGKTQTLAQIAWTHMEKGEKVLMLSYSNVSVDGAILRVASMRENIEPGRLIRYGFPKDEKILSNHYLSAYNLAIYKNPELLKKRNQLVALKNSLDKHDVKRVQIEKDLEQIRQSLKVTEQQYVRNGRFVATTVSKAVVDRTIRGISYDVVIFDEASMAAIPQIMYAASLARKHFVCMGDFRQLPPIVQSGKESLLNADIFQYCGITQAVDQGSNHKWLCLLDTQYRMHPEIADFAGKSIYNGLLKSADGMAVKNEKKLWQQSRLLDVQWSLLI